MIDPEKYGVSFSLKQCRGFGIDPHKTLDWLLEQGWRRFRLMSYWNECEKEQGVYDFTELDWQIAQITEAGGVISLCLGVKQPRWPEYHWPEWAKGLSEEQKTAALLAFLEAVVTRYRDEPAVISYQLENEALLKNFGRNIIINRDRLRTEYKKVHELDPSRPIMMSASNGWGIPLRHPIPAAIGFSVYTVIHSHGMYHRTVQSPWLHRLRKGLICMLLGRRVFIHELQCEPWGPDAIWKLTSAQQDESMSPAQIQKNIRWAKRIGAYPIDFWGGEWWYWRWQQGSRELFEEVNKHL